VLTFANMCVCAASPFFPSLSSLHLFPLFPSLFLLFLLPLFSPFRHDQWFLERSNFSPQQVRTELRRLNDIWCILRWKSALAFASAPKTQMLRWRIVQHRGRFRCVLCTYIKNYAPWSGAPARTSKHPRIRQFRHISVGLYSLRTVLARCYTFQAVIIIVFGL